MSISAPPPTSSTPQRTTPTWEVELLISGVAVFAMLQLPGLLDDALFSLRPRFDSMWRQLLTLVYMYCKGAALILGMTFVTHLLLRARWIAMVGMHAVHPQGIRWDRLRLGPVQREIERSRERPFPELIENADRQATTVFATGVILAIFVIMLALFAGTVLAFAMLLSQLNGNRIDMPSMLITLLIILILPYSLGMLVDRWRGASLAPHGRPRRLLKQLLTFYAHIGFSRNSNPVQALLASYAGERKVLLTTMALTFFALFAAALSPILLTSSTELGNYSLFPSTEALPSIDSAHYDDQRNPARDPARAYIATMIATSPYVRLTIPYRPDRDALPLQQSCPQAETQRGVEQAQTRLSCLAALYQVKLDGNPLPQLKFDIANDSRTNRPALLTMIDVRKLAQGRHVLDISYASTSKHDSENSKITSEQIVFWR